MLGPARPHGNRTTVLHEQVSAVVQPSAHLGSALHEAPALDSSLDSDLDDGAASVGGQPSVTLSPIRVAASSL